MNKQKVSTKQQRYLSVECFLKSGQTKTDWCKENGIALGTFYRWFDEYKHSEKNTSFVELKSLPKKPTCRLTDSKNPLATADIIVEIGVCKIHIPSQLDPALLVKVIQEVNASHV